MFPIKIGLKQGDAFSPLFFSFALEYDIMRNQVNQEGLKFMLRMLMCLAKVYILQRKAQKF
jgi:hypothetical protein